MGKRHAIGYARQFEVLPVAMDDVAVAAYFRSLQFALPR